LKGLEAKRGKAKVVQDLANGLEQGVQFTLAEEGFTADVIWSTLSR